MRETLRYIEERTGRRSRVAVVLGSGLGGLVEEVDEREEIPYAGIPGWPPSTVEGHAGALVFGSLDGLSVALMAGRNHLYEGYSAAQVTLGVRALAALGVRSLVVTNAAGGIRADYEPGELVAIADHVNLQGTNPLVGPNDGSVGPRFPDMSEAYSGEYRTLAREAARELGFELREGVYAAVLGPNYETPAEIRYLRAIGCDLVGMSTALEVIAARHAGVKVLGVSCVTNLAAGVKPGVIDHAEVLERGRAAGKRLGTLLRAVLPRIAALEEANRG